MTFACITGHGGLVSRLLKSKVFLPMSRLSFGVYLVHLSVIYSRYFSSKQTLFWSNLEFFGSAVHSFFLSLIVAFFLYVLFEAPIVRVEKLAFQGAAESSSSLQGGIIGHMTIKSSRSSFYCHCKDVLKNQQCDLGAKEPPEVNYDHSSESNEQNSLEEQENCNQTECNHKQENITQEEENSNEANHTRRRAADLSSFVIKI